MDIFIFAMKKEKDRETLYRYLIRKTAGSGIADISKMPADEGMKHSKELYL